MLNSIVSGNYRKSQYFMHCILPTQSLDKQVYSTYVIYIKYKILTSVSAYSIENIFSNLITYMYLYTDYTGERVHLF